MNVIRTAVVVAALTFTATFASADPRNCPVKNGDSFIVRDDGITFMNGQGMSSESLRSIQNKYGASFFWIRRAGKRYVVRDRATIERALAAVANQSDVARKQAEIGSAQAEVGMKQAAIGMQQAATALSTDAVRRRDLELKQKSLSGDQQRLSERQQQLAQQQEKISGECDRRLCAIADEAIRSGKAEPVR
jgi:hypothetical protein